MVTNNSKQANIASFGYESNAKLVYDKTTCDILPQVAGTSHSTPAGWSPRAHHTSLVAPYGHNTSCSCWYNVSISTNFYCMNFIQNFTFLRNQIVLKGKSWSRDWASNLCCRHDHRAWPNSCPEWCFLFFSFSFCAFAWGHFFHVFVCGYFFMFSIVLLSA